ncbi:MAG: hypothetical protein WD749_13715 [Phycisphaerales bacterium]
MAMLLQGVNEAEFELGLIEDRFPEVQDGTGDSAWCTLLIRVGTPEDTWEETAPCLNFFEVQNLVEWLEALSRARPDAGEIELLGPELRFSVAAESQGEVTIRIGFHLEGRPRDLALDAPTDRHYVDIRIGRDQLRAAAAALRRDIESLTARAGRPADHDGDSGLLGEPEEDLGLAPPEVSGRLDEDDDERMF